MVLMICEDCKKELKTLPLKEAIKNKKWWKQELKDFGFGNLLIIIAILLIFSGMYFEFGPKIKNPCDWCKVNIKDEIGNDYSKTCTEWIEERYGQKELNLEVDNGDIQSIYTKEIN